jgi:Arc/MetJ family transcription regulator
MAKTLIDIDEDALAQAQRVLGTGTKRETVNAALANVAAQGSRREAVLREFERGTLYQAALEAEAGAWQ